MISIVTEENKKIWDEIVKGIPNSDVYYLFDYVKIFSNHEKGEPILFLYESGSKKAINVCIKRKIPKLLVDEKKNAEYFDLTTPYGYGGFLLNQTFSDKDLEDMNKKYIEACEQNNIISEIVRFHPITKNYNNMNHIYDVQKIGPTITIDISKSNDIWNNMDSKNRNMIRKAQKNNIRIYWGRDEKIIHKFKIMYEETMNRDKAKSYYYFNQEFYQSILNELKYNSLLFYAKLENEIIAMSIIMFDSTQIHYHLSASDNNFSKFGATNLLLYEVAKWGQANNFRTFHLGGGLGGKEDSLYKFKKVFNKKSDSEFKIGKKIFIEDIYNELVAERIKTKKDISLDYFPQYRG